MTQRPDRPDPSYFSDPAHFRKPTRREFLYVGFLGGLSLTLGDVLRAEAQTKSSTVAGGAAGPEAEMVSKEGVAKSVIQIFLPGGMSAQESFDPKIYAPSEYRGAFGSIPCKIDGERFSELFSKTAQIADRCTVIRSMTHGEAAHERGVHNMFTGYRPSPAIQFPSMGSVVSHELGSRNDLPPYVCVPHVPNEFATSGYLSSAFGPFSLGSDPADKGFTVRDLSLPPGVDAQRMDRRKGLLALVDAHFRSQEKADALSSMDSFYQRAYAMISSPKAKEAFNIQAEPEALRNSYGMNQAGQRMLMARRLVEAGVRFVSLTAGSWDHHTGIEGGMRGNAPHVDQAFAALITDLEQRGMLGSTLVMLTTEFGRSPKINSTAGRDHYPKVFSIVMAGGGIKRGLVYGKSDATSVDVDENPVSVPDYAATVYHQLGIPFEKRLMSPGDRPIDIVRGGKVLTELLV
ncbi:MAG: DUF1501 domain-containing protein [Planctomycetota bacterium]|nr:DUF1501 domain-containing protein [Planctomycetota bacterium]